MADRADRGAAACDLGEEGKQPRLHLARALAAWRLEIASGGLARGERGIRHGAQFSEAQPLPFAPRHLDQPRLAPRREAEDLGRLDRTAERAGQPATRGE